MEIKHNKLDTIAEVFCMILLIVTTLYTIYMYIQLPEKYQFIIMQQELLIDMEINLKYLFY